MINLAVIQCRLSTLVYRKPRLLAVLSGGKAEIASVNGLAKNSDEELAARAPDDPDAFAELYRRYLDRVYAYHYMRTGMVHDAQDLTSQTFLAALEGISGYRGRGCFAAWLLSIARRKTADYYRRSPRTENYEWIENKAALEPLVEEDVEDRLKLEHIQQALGSIQPERAEALILRVFSHMKAGEVAGMMDKTEGAVRNLVYRALLDIRRIVGEGQEVS